LFVVTRGNDKNRNLILENHHCRDRQTRPVPSYQASLVKILLDESVSALYDAGGVVDKLWSPHLTTPSVQRDVLPRCEWKSVCSKAQWRGSDCSPTNCWETPSGGNRCA